jgi:hypothetical protein
MCAALQAMERAKVLDFELQKQLVPYMKDITPLPGVRCLAAGANRQQRMDSSGGASGQQRTDSGSSGQTRAAADGQFGLGSSWQMMHKQQAARCCRVHGIRGSAGAVSVVHVTAVQSHEQQQ